jgi:hypothetical protein
MFSFLHHEMIDKNKNSVYTSIEHLPFFLTAGNISSPLWRRILSIPVARECNLFHNLETLLLQHITSLRCKWIDLQ